MTTKQSIWTVLALLTVGAIAWFGLGWLGASRGFIRQTGPQPQQPGPPTPTALRANGRHEDRQPLGKHRTTRAAKERPAGSSADSSGRTPTPADGLATISGRCVAAESDAPLPGVEIYLIGRLPLGSLPLPGWEFAWAFEEAYQGQLEGWSRTDTPGWMRPITLDRHFLSAPALERLRAEGKIYQRPANAITDDEGRFRIRFDPGGLTWSMFTATGGRTPARFGARTFRADEHRDYGVIRLRQGFRLQGRLVDQHGVGPVGCDVALVAEPARRHFGLDLAGLPIACCTKSSADGQFAFSTPVPQGAWCLRVSGPGIEPADLPIRIAGADVHRVFEIRSLPVISGSLTETTENFEGTELLAISVDQVIRGRGRIANQRFTIRAEKASKLPVRIVAGSDLSEILETPTSIAWGRDDVKIRMAKTRPLEILLLAKGTDLPIQDPVSVFARRPWEEEPRQLRANQPSADGVLRIEHFPRGPQQLLIQCQRGQRWWPSAVAEVDALQSEPRRLTIHRVPAIDAKVIVLNARDRPVHGARVEARPSGWTFGPHEHRFTARTDSEGVAWIRLPSGQTQRITLRRGDLPPETRDVLGIPDGDPIRIRLAR